MNQHPSSSPLRGELRVPGDKSISHRAVMLASLAEGTSRIRGFLPSADCLSTIAAFRAMGVGILTREDSVVVHGSGLFGLKRPLSSIDCGNSGTTMRLLSGILAGQRFASTLTGDRSLSSRPMRRVMEPLSLMGADIRSEDDNGCAPLLIAPSALSGISYQMPVASAQVKSCVLLAGLYADSMTIVREAAPSRDHTERMLAQFGAELGGDMSSVTLYPGQPLSACEIDVPADISSAAYFIAAALIVPGSELLLRDVGVNPTRDGLLDVIRMMGGEVELLDLRHISGEPRADLLVRHQALHGCTIGGALIPRLIDELPVIAVLAAFAEGETIIKDAQELRVKESDRISLVTSNLARMGADVKARDDGMVIRGGKTLTGAAIETADDHRIAMAFAVASLMADGSNQLSSRDCVRISYPSFFSDLEMLSGA